MKLLLVFILALLGGTFSGFEVFGESTFFETVKFIQYLDENTALEEVRNGNLDIYYYRISSDRLESSDSREGLRIFDSTGGSYSILTNPAETEKFNPFSIKEVRFALNYLVDRKLIVNELMGGYGSPMISYYSPSDPEYLTIIEQLEKFNFRYNPTLAEEMISDALMSKDAKKINEKWMFNGKPIEITIFIRSDDPVRKSIGEILASELQNIGFEVKKEFGDLNKAFVIVYGSDPSDLKWNLYTEGWGRSAFVRYDSVGIGQMYSPWFSNMPGFNDPNYWNYKNEKIDELTQKIYTGTFESSEERSSLIQEAITEGINESVRIFLASKIDQYVVNEKINGIVNDFGAGVPSRFTPINAKGDKEELVIGVKQIYQGAWNPVMGLSDSYSRHIWGIISDPITFKHPFSGETFPVRASWNVETAGPTSKMNVPKDAMIWDPKNQEWVNVSPETQSISKVTFDFEFSKWHNGQMMDMNDILYSLYFTIEWGTQINENDKTFDTEFTPRAAQTVQTIKGINPIDEDTIEVYVDYWHFDEGEIADWAALWSTIPWEISAAMEEAVLDGKVSYSRSGATSKNVNWVSLIIPKDSKLIQEYLEEFKRTNYIPEVFQGFENNQEYFDSRYESSIKWIETNNHAVISNGPFFLKSYSPESRTIAVSSFNDSTYPFEVGHWSEFEAAKIPKISHIEMPKIINKNSDISIQVSTINADSILFFVSNSKGNVIASESTEVRSNTTEVHLQEDTINRLDVGANSLKIFAISSKVLKPDYYTTSFLVTESYEELPKANQDKVEFDTYDVYQIAWIIIPIIIITAIIIIKKIKSI
ncbi:ABC transporter substrate-binding protein [Nitrosopumilus sp. K4]|uniref:ABC transporter substrate-binding protein n=1 Tax=Nitrosopumilus sp. K4 TaxID=2795383 RepID=UPI001BAE1A08|nr:ABC transporter substrate-binding protein [Nitrosopumilus sp. K4]QUC63881.1 ABC transporter substrate-binding protein [Nitrosopumilus sp. K4]